MAFLFCVQLLQCILLASFTIRLSEAGLCRIDTFVSRNIQSNDSDISTEAPISTQLIRCPRANDPPENEYCCYVSTESNASVIDLEDSIIGVTSILKCCPYSESSTIVPFLTDRVTIILVVTLFVVVLVTTVVILVCCFWTRCPLYMACRIRYRQDDIIAYATKEEETTHLNAMPPEEQKGISMYSPNAVKITPRNEE